ncbi:OPT oligopeptide transporter protein-domain-containing protein [Pisolithus marmoratus]|nr:OPT oligopeptide transporter protein-domain-containing protein [Pisolithus marmoratus]
MTCGGLQIATCPIFASMKESDNLMKFLSLFGALCAFNRNSWLSREYLRKEKTEVHRRFSRYEPMAQGPPNNLARAVTRSDGVSTGKPSPERITQFSWDAKPDPESHGVGNNVVFNDERELVSHVISTDDDPSLNPWTFRSFFIGVGLSAFGSALAEIYYFKPQTLTVSLMFLAIISYIIGTAMETLIPRRGIFRWLNPHPFNKKENAFVIIMASAAANAALATEVLAVQRMYYNVNPNTATSIFLLFSSQLLGYGIGGLMRSVLLYPSKMFYPSILPLVSMFDALFQDGTAAQRKIQVFWAVFSIIFVWELFPEWIFPLLTGFSIFCLAAPNSPAVSRLFGGSNGNEGLGLLSICFDWQYISALNPFTVPLKALRGTSPSYVGLSQVLFYENGTLYDQSLIMDANYQVDPQLVAEQGLPYYASTWVVYLTATNLALGATIVHLLLWIYDDLRAAWTWLSPASLWLTWKEFDGRFWKYDGRDEEAKIADDLDPHYAQMLKYPDAPNSWYGLTAVLSLIIALVVIYKSDSTLPWWGLVVALLLATVFILFVVALYAMTGVPLSIQTFVQMVAGYLHRGKPMANMYFVLYSYNTMNQAQLLLRDLKVAQYVKLPPRAAFAAQVIGTLFGAVVNFVLMNSIINNRRDILLSVQGSNVWSGQQVQQYNSQAIAWGGLSNELFSISSRYHWVPLSYVIGLFVPIPFWLVHRYWPKLRADFMYTPLVCGFIGTLAAGINASALSFLIVGFTSQWWLHHNYIVAAALDGGTQVMVFILSFAVFGAAGHTHLFPSWWGANQAGNYDHCVLLQ